MKNGCNEREYNLVVLLTGESNCTLLKSPSNSNHCIEQIANIKVINVHACAI